MNLRRLALAVSTGVLSSALVGCAGGSPLLHPAQTLDTGVVRAAAGVSANVAVGSIADDLRTAREQAAQNPNAPGPPGTNPDYAKGALVAAGVAPGLAPYVAARVGIGNRVEGGIAYTARGARIDLRRSFDASSSVALSAGLGVTGVFYGRVQGTTLPNVDLSALHGYGADVPLLVGWRSDAGLYHAWLGARVGFEHDVIEFLTTEPVSGTPLTGLSATRTWGGAVVGAAVGFRHVHVAFELDAAYQSIVGDYNSTHASVQGVSLIPASALWWTF